jgi:penicillin-binding protein 1A
MSPGRLGPDRPVPGPVGIHAITRRNDGKQRAIELPNGAKARNKVKTRRVLDPGIASSIGTILQGVVKNGTAQRAQLGDVPVAGKTGTTENYGDAWFVGWTPKYTVAVWVGYPKKFQPMKTEFRGEPVAGGTFPAGIWKTFMESVLRIDPPPKPKEGDEVEGLPGATPAPGATTAPATPVEPAPSAPEETAPETSGGGGGTGEPAPAEPEEPAPQEQQDIPPAEQPPTAPEGGDGGTTAPSGGTAPPADGTG